MDLFSLFPKKNNIIIGALHFPPLLGYEEFGGFEVALSNALADLKSFEQGGVDAIIFENNYDIPHTTFVEPPVVASLTYLGEKLRATTKLPLGISVLWNDYKTAFSIAKILNLQFIRLPVFVDQVKAEHGIITGEPEHVQQVRNQLKAEHVALLTDIHVKHATLLSPHDLLASASLAIQHGSDGLIVTGKWTGDAPSLDKLLQVRTHIGSFPLFVGSGMNAENAKNLCQLANGAIVSTSLKQGENKVGETNVKSYNQRIDEQKVKELVTACHG